MKPSPSDDPQLAPFLAGKSEYTRALFDHFVTEFEALGAIGLHPTKTMIAVSTAADAKRIAWVTQFGRNFIHVVFPFDELYADNLCFQKVAPVPGARQYNHHFRMLFREDVNDEVRGFMRKSLKI